MENIVTSKSDNLFELLPYEIIEHILSYLYIDIVFKLKEISCIKSALERGLVKYRSSDLDVYMGSVYPLATTRLLLSGITLDERVSFDVMDNRVLGILSPYKNLERLVLISPTFLIQEILDQIPSLTDLEYSPRVCPVDTTINSSRLKILKAENIPELHCDLPNLERLKLYDVGNLILENSNKLTSIDLSQVSGCIKVLPTKLSKLFLYNCAVSIGITQVSWVDHIHLIIVHDFLKWCHVNLLVINAISMGDVDILNNIPSIKKLVTETNTDLSNLTKYIPKVVLHNTIQRYECIPPPNIDKLVIRNATEINLMECNVKSLTLSNSITLDGVTLLQGVRWTDTLLHLDVTHTLWKCMCKVYLPNLKTFIAKHAATSDCSGCNPILPKLEVANLYKSQNIGVLGMEGCSLKSLNIVGCKYILGVDLLVFSNLENITLSSESMIKGSTEKLKLQYGEDLVINMIDENE